jgi:hypothetical protein
MSDGWSQVLDPSATHLVREEAWEDLAPIVKRPMLDYLRRCMSGFREPERTAEEILESIFLDHAGSGTTDLRLRSCIAAALTNRQYELEVDEEFDRAWTSSLLLAALQEMKGSLPRTYALLVRLYDQPEADEQTLAKKLEEPVEDVHEQLIEGRAELQQRFLESVRNTLPDPEMATAEAAHLLVHTRALFGE